MINIFSNVTRRGVYRTLRLKSTVPEHKLSDSTFESTVPKSNTREKPDPLYPTKIDEETIGLLEQLSLVDCANKQGIKTLEDAISFADKIHQINTENIDPMYTVLEDRYLSLRDDEITDGNIQQDILKNATVTEEDYFVAPPGNIPLQTRKNLLHD